MTDQRPDIDIEAERPVFEQDAAAAGWATDRDETGRYWSTMTDFRWRGWLARARIAAEREREMLREARDGLRLAIGCYAGRVWTTVQDADVDGWIEKANVLRAALGTREEQA